MEESAQKTLTGACEEPGIQRPKPPDEKGQHVNEHPRDGVVTERRHQPGGERREQAPKTALSVLDLYPYSSSSATSSSKSLKAAGAVPSSPRARLQ